MASRSQQRRCTLHVTRLEDRTVPATHIYTNAGVTFNWSEAANWDAAGAPTTGEVGGTIVVFPLAGTPSNQDIVGLVIARINFTNTGNTVTLVQPLGIDGGAATTNLQNTIGSKVSSLAMRQLEGSHHAQHPRCPGGMCHVRVGAGARPRGRIRPCRTG